MNIAVQNTINDLKLTGYINENGIFDIDENMLSAYCRLYHIHSSGNGNGMFDCNYARKLAGVNLLKFKLVKGVKSSNIKEGILYIISNPAWPDHRKVGITKDLHGRLSSYQTYDPHRSYKIDTYEFVLHRRLVERDLLNRFSTNFDRGEWLRTNDARSLIKYVRNTYGIPSSSSRLTFKS